jgi:hypothetical protein
MAATEAKPNAIGLTHYSSWDSDTGGKLLTDQLAEADITFERIEIPRLVGTAGCAYLVLYTRQNGEPMTVLVVPSAAADSWCELYFYFAGVTREQAVENERVWIDRYDAASELKRAWWAEEMAARANHRTA